MHTHRTITRDAAEAMLVSGLPLAANIIEAITSAAPDVAFNSRCDTKYCGPTNFAEPCLRKHTTQQRAASLAVQGWCTMQQWYGETEYDVHHWRNGSSHLVEEAYPGAHMEADTALFSLTTDLAEFQHLQHFKQQYWFVPNLLIIATSSEQHPVTIHTLTPQHPRTVLY
jgi:hypothetical protein